MFDCEIKLKYVPETNQYLKLWVKFLAKGNNGGIGWGSIPRLTDCESEVQPTATRHDSIQRVVDLNTFCKV